ncbi:papilin-like isoform X2 [Rhipicephalus sanguineus]|uniref:papilin-like isoform X2 n=1 Tax=Rhipicephalus sanguineus TaxID=34632 RepID=UPI00189619A4|nr:papilin-like isoform X2 [Rhipicephalus sanguineus]
MEIPFRCLALAMCIAIVSGLNENAVQSENGERGISGVTIGSNGNGVLGGDLNFLPGSGLGSGNSAASGTTGNELPNRSNRIGHPGSLPWNITTIGKKPKRCKELPEKGHCRAFMPTWYFDFRLQLCRIFIYGGCGGNDNQFSSEKKCQEVCLLLKATEVCQLARQSTAAPRMQQQQSGNHTSPTIL